MSPGQLYRLDEAARLLAFPSVNALRCYLSRHPGLVKPIYRRHRRSTLRLMSWQDLQHVREITTFRRYSAPHQSQISAS